MKLSSYILFASIAALVIEKRGHKSEYIQGASLGQGTYGCVVKSTHQPSKRECALKLPTSQDLKGSVESLVREASILKDIKSDFIVHLCDTVELPTEHDTDGQVIAPIALDLELIRGPNLYTFVHFSGSRFLPSIRRRIFYDLVNAVQDSHSYGYAHLDIKESNAILVAPINEILGNLRQHECDPIAKLCDFGLAKSIYMNVSTNETGTYEYLAPEAVSPQFLIGSTKVEPGPLDIWALGCILYSLHARRLPFSYDRSGTSSQQEASRNSMNSRILNLEYDTSRINDRLVMDLLRKIFVRDPRDRIGITEILHHPYADDTPRCCFF